MCAVTQNQANPYCPLQNAGKYLRLLGPSLAQVKDLSGIEIPQEGLDDLSALWSTASQGVLGQR
jgi:hypothetical protein